MLSQVLLFTSFLTQIANVYQAGACRLDSTGVSYEEIDSEPSFKH